MKTPADTDLLLEFDDITLTDVQGQQGVLCPYVQHGSIVAEQQRGCVADTGECEEQHGTLRGVYGQKADGEQQSLQLYVSLASWSCVS